jgi:hypothetical protein
MIKRLFGTMLVVTWVMFCWLVIIIVIRAIWNTL